jgi:DNA-binding NarL/FixJ family response regulator
MSTAAVSLVVIDDHQLVVLGLRTLFHQRRDIDVLSWAHDAEAGLDACRTHTPDVAVIDVALEGSEEDGLELCRRLRAELPRVEVVIYTGIDEIGLAEKAFDAGAAGVVSKGDKAADLLKAVLMVARGKRYTSPVFAEKVGSRLFEKLTPTQLQALRLLARGLDRRETAAEMGVGEETVKSHVAEVRRKLGARTSAQAVAIGLVNSLFEPDALS